MFDTSWHEERVKVCGKVHFSKMESNHYFTYMCVLKIYMHVYVHMNLYVILCEIPLKPKFFEIQGIGFMGLIVTVLFFKDVLQNKIMIKT